jgi:hypothetical protein
MMKMKLGSFAGLACFLIAVYAAMSVFHVGLLLAVVIVCVLVFVIFPVVRFIP